MDAQEHEFLHHVMNSYWWIDTAFWVWLICSTLWGGFKLLVQFIQCDNEQERERDRRRQAILLQRQQA